MAEHMLIKTPYGLGPADQSCVEWLEKMRLGGIVSAKVKQVRNGKFHKKFFAMLNVAYANHDWPEIEHPRWGVLRTTYDVFRDYVTVRAGYYKVEYTPGGNVRIEPKSISFANMDEDEFAKLYSDVLDVILSEFLTNWSSGDMDAAVNQMLSFA